MTDRLYPTSLAEMDAWRRRVKTTLDEARKRFVQFVVLDCLGAFPDLQHALAFKGGNALRFVYGNPRATLDLDFTASATFPDDAAQVRSLFDRALVAGGRRHGVKIKCQKVQRNPARKEATLPTFQIAVGYQFPNDRYFADYESTQRNVATVVSVEVSLNDLVCEAAVRPLGKQATIRVCALEDILAEKLRALLQQKPRNRTRPQDVFDIARIVKDQGKSLSITKIRDYLVRKCAVRSIPIARAEFAVGEVQNRAAIGYDELLAETQVALIPFDAAWRIVLELVDQLQLPENPTSPS